MGYVCHIGERERERERERDLVTKCREWQPETSGHFGTTILASHVFNEAVWLQISGLESELSQLSSSLSHYQGLSAEYKVQLERVRADQETVTKELHIKEQEIDHLKRENLIEAEKVRRPGLHLPLMNNTSLIASSQVPATAVRV